MREIKFRIWDKHFNEFNDYHFNRSTFKDFVRWDDRFIIEQFTGLLDKNGNEVYEGDILVLYDNFGNLDLYTVEWSKGCYQFVGNGGPGEWLSLEEFEGSEISGNIHEKKP